MKSKPLGKGLQALFDETPLSGYIDKGVSFLEVPVDKIKPNHLQPREDVDPESFEALKESIRQKGLIQPIAVRQVDDGFEVVAGQRRLDAVKSLERSTIPAYILDIGDDKSLLEVSLLENIRRADLNPIEVAAGYKKLSDEFGMTQQEISDVFSIDRTSVTNMIRLLKLPKEIKEEVRSGNVSMGHARALLSLPSAAEQKLMTKKILKEDLSVRQTEDILKKVKTRKPKKGKTPSKKSSAILNLEEKLMYTLGSQVRIKTGKSGGKIEIDYYSNEDLDRLMELFSVIENKY